MPRLLVADDEPAILQFFRRAFEDRPVEVLTASSGREALELVTSHNPDAAVFDVQMPGMSGLELLREILRRDTKLPVIIITASGTSDTAIDAMKLGAFDYLLKPLTVSQLRELVERAFEIRRLAAHPVAFGDNVNDVTGRGDALVGCCPAMQEVYKAIGRVASQNVTVLISGESGTGKELVARAIYQHSDRAGRPFLAVNCAAIPEPLLESELFGHEKGAFTGADHRRIGKFEQCDGGTLLLDEIGDMPAALQSKMLRVLHDQHFERVGSNETICTDVRMIAATNQNLKRLVEENRFRPDLYYRLNVYEIQLPPLRERPEDLPLLVSHFLKQANKELGKEVVAVTPEAFATLKAFPWPGNVRELQSVLKQAILKTVGPVVQAEFLPEVVCGARIPCSFHTGDCPIPNDQPPDVSEQIDLQEFLASRLSEGSTQIYDEAIALVEKHVIAGVLRHTQGNQVQAARLLGLARNTLRSKVKQYGISIGRVVDVDADR